MFSGIPLPKVVADTGPGGGIPTAMNALNELEKQRYANQISRIQAMYAPLTTQATAASKLAYANLMGPQFLAKLMGHSDIVANSPQLQDPSTISTLYKAGTGTGTGNAMIDSIMQQSQPKSPLDHAVNAVKNAFGFGSQQSPSIQTNAMTQQPGMSSQNQQTSAPSQNQEPGTIVFHGPQQNASAQPAQQPNVGQNNYAENAGNFAGIKKEGEELGSLRAKAIDQAGKQYQQDVEGMTPLKHLMDISQSPVFMNMRNSIPGFQEFQLNTLKNFTGTPEQKRMIGDYIASAKSVVGSTVQGFKGRTMEREFDFANQLKIGDNDNINVILGKLESLATFKQAAMQRDRIATNLMTKNHMNQGDAYEAANNQVNMNDIRKNISDQLQSPVRVINKKTGEKKYISPKEYNDLLNEK